MNKGSSSKGSQTDWERVSSLRDEEIDTSDIPEVSSEQIARGKFRFGREPLPRGKVRINILLDAGIVAYFKAQAAGRGYQTLINEALKESIHQRDLESTLRRIIREELRSEEERLVDEESGGEV
jgi:uncharacterized protein (DUF4415 family)